MLCRFIVSQANPLDTIMNTANKNSDTRQGRQVLINEIRKAEKPARPAPNKYIFPSSR